MPPRRRGQARAAVQHHCKVTPNGLAHLFVDLDYGRVCACGRKVFVFSLDPEEPALRDVLQDPVAPWKSATWPTAKQALKDSFALQAQMRR